MHDEDLKLIRQIVASDGRKYTAGNIDRSKYDRLVDMGWLTPFKTNISDVEYQATDKGRAAALAATFRVRPNRRLQRAFQLHTPLILDRGFTSVRDTGGADWGLKEPTEPIFQGMSRTFSWRHITASAPPRAG